MTHTFSIDTFRIDDISPVFIIAELSANHNGSLENAVKTIQAAKHAGADAIKLQTYTADTITIDVKTDDFKINQGTIWDGKYLYDLYKEAHTPWEWHEQLFKVAQNEGLICFSSPFDNSAVDFLDKLKTPAYKIASFEITDIPLIEYVASKGKPVIISTGIAELNDIEEAIAACHRQGNNEIALLKCTSAYPAPVEEANLVTIPDMANRFDTIVGLSDHTLGDTVAIAAVALGAKIIEKHFILDRENGGPDAEFSMEPEEFRVMVQSIRTVEKAIGQVTYKLTEKTKSNKKFARSLYIIKDIAAGEKFTLENIRSIRPGNGLPPKFLREVLGKKALVNLSRGTPLSIDHTDS
jgi:pseudaminic acid synthase